MKSSFDNFGEGCAYMIMALVFVLVICFIICYPMMLLWNWLVPTIFGLPTITFWQMLGLEILCNFLFKSNINIKK